MSRFKMDDGTILDTARAVQKWGEKRDFDGHNRIGRSSGSQWSWQTLMKTRKGRYYIEHTSNWEGTRPHCEWVSPEEACRFLVLNELELPDDLAKLESEVSE